MGLLPKTESGSPSLNLTFSRLNIDNERPSSKRLKYQFTWGPNVWGSSNSHFLIWCLLCNDVCCVPSLPCTYCTPLLPPYKSDWVLKSASLNLDIHFCNHTNLSIKSSLNLNLHFCKHTHLSIKEGSLFIMPGSPKPWCPHRTFDTVESGQWDWVRWSWFHNV